MRRVLILLGLWCAALSLGVAVASPAAARSADAAAKLPKLIGTVTPMRSKLDSHASVAELIEEASDALEAIFGDKTTCDTHTARRWLVNLHQLAGESGKLVDREEARFTDYRIRCAGRETDRRNTSLPDPYYDAPKKLPPCPPGAYGCPLPGQTCPDGVGPYDECGRYPPLPICDGDEQDCTANPPCAEAGECDQPYQDPNCSDCAVNPEVPFLPGGLQTVF